MTKSTHEQFTDRQKEHQKKKGIVISIIKDNLDIHQSKIIKLVEPPGERHMSGTTVERIVRELKNEELIKSKKIGNKNCFRFIRDCDDDDDIEKHVKKSVSNIENYLETIQPQLERLNRNGKNKLANDLGFLEDYLNPIPESYFADVSPTELPEDQMIKEIKSIVKHSVSKSKQSKFQEAKIKHNEIRKIRKTQVRLGKLSKSLNNKTVKYSDTLHEQVKNQRMLEKQLSQLAKIEYNLETGNTSELKFLFDENCSPSNKFLNAHPICENVKYRLSEGVKDEAILKRISNKEFVIVTKDIRFALDAIAKEFKVIYHNVERNKDYFLQTGEFESKMVSEFKGFELK